MKVLGLEKIKENLIKSGLFELKKEWKNRLIFIGVNNPYEINFNIYDNEKTCFNVIVSNCGKRSDRIIDIKSNIDLVMNTIEEFTIGTVSFGNITVKECNKLIENYNLAMKITSKLNTIFFIKETKQQIKENELNKIFKSKEFKTIETDTITNDDILEVYNYCINLIDELKKDIDKPSIEDIKEFMTNESNKEEYILSEYESNYTYVDFIIDTLDSNIRFL